MSRLDRIAALAAAALAVGWAGPSRAQQQAPVTVDACAPCHGLDVIAKEADVPHLAGQNLVYLYNQLQAFRSGKRPHKEMRYMARHLTEQEMEALAAYFASLPRS
ncbi:c-type cytochrome [Nostoc sp. NIES-2111]